MCSIYTIVCEQTVIKLLFGKEVNLYHSLNWNLSLSKLFSLSWSLLQAPFWVRNLALVT